MRFDVIDFSNDELFLLYFDASYETIGEFSKIIGEIRVRSAKWGHDIWHISGPEKIEYLEFLAKCRVPPYYVDPGECRRIAEKLYAAEMRFTSKKRLKFAEIADVFSLGSIMNGVVM